MTPDLILAGLVTLGLLAYVIDVLIRSERFWSWPLSGWITLAVFFPCVTAITCPLGGFLKRVLEGEKHILQRPLGGLECCLYRLAGIDPMRE